MEKNSSLSIDDVERRFQEDMEKAKALSLETAAFEKFRQEKERDCEIFSQRKTETIPGIPKRDGRNANCNLSPTMEPRSLKISIKPRPRPGVFGAQHSGLVPPPLPKRQFSISSDVNDLINLKSPVSLRQLKLDDTVLQELDLAFPTQKLPSSLNQTNAPVSIGKVSCQPVAQMASASLSSPVPSVTHLGLEQFRQLPVSFNENVINHNLIDLSANTGHSRYSILYTFDPLLTSSETTKQDEVSFSSASASVSTINLSEGTEEFNFNQDYDPFEYFLGLSQRTPDSPSIPPVSSISETIYEVLTKEKSPIKATASANKKSPVVSSLNSKDLLLKVDINQVNVTTFDPELTTFVNLVCQMRMQYRSDEDRTNAGFLVSYH